MNAKLRSAVYNALSEVMYEFPNASREELEDATEWFADQFYKEPEDPDWPEESDWYETDRGLYSPSMPWNAPGMSISDFI